MTPLEMEHRLKFRNDLCIKGQPFTPQWSDAASYCRKKGGSSHALLVSGLFSCGRKTRKNPLTCQNANYTSAVSKDFLCIIQTIKASKAVQCLSSIFNLNYTSVLSILSLHSKSDASDFYMYVHVASKSE